jgi:hypothetical protein
LTDNISDKDKKDWETFLSSNEKLPNKDDKLKKKSPLKIKSIDLHGYTLDQANKFIESFIIKSYEENINKLIVVTGKGLHSQNEKDPYVSQELSILKICIFNQIIQIFINIFFINNNFFTRAISCSKTDFI